MGKLIRILMCIRIVNSAIERMKLNSPREFAALMSAINSESIDDARQRLGIVGSITRFLRGVFFHDFV